MALSTDNKAKLQAAIDALVFSNAPQIPFDAKIIEQVAAVSASIGFQTTGAFVENAKNSPISTLLTLAKFIGA